MNKFITNVLDSTQTIYAVRYDEKIVTIQLKKSFILNVDVKNEIIRDVRSLSDNGNNTISQETSEDIHKNYDIIIAIAKAYFRGFEHAYLIYD